MKRRQNLSLPISRNYVNLEDFGREFLQALKTTECGVFKLERIQSYQEPDNSSYIAWMRGDREEALKLIPENIYKHNVDVYRDVAQRGLSWERIRLVEKPLSTYLQWEFESYKETAKYGERIGVIDITDEHPRTLLKRSTDFLLFDYKIAIVHDYGTEGLLQGAWIVDSEVDLARYRKLADLCVGRALPLGEYQYLNRDSK